MRVNLWTCMVFLGVASIFVSLLKALIVYPFGQKHPLNECWSNFHATRHLGGFIGLLPQPGHRLMLSKPVCCRVGTVGTDVHRHVKALSVCGDSWFNLWALLGQCRCAASPSPRVKSVWLVPDEAALTINHTHSTMSYRALSCTHAKRNLLSTPTHASLLVCTRRKADFPPQQTVTTTLTPGGEPPKSRAVFWRKRYMVLFYWSKKQLCHWPANTRSKCTSG